MSILVIAHLVALGLWGGIVAAEVVLELQPRRNQASHEFVARTHYWIDLIIELPVIGLVITTGVALTIGAWPVPPVYWVHMGSALVAIGANLFCVTAVTRREHATTQTQRLAQDRRIRASVAGAAFALVAVIVGFAMAGH